MICSGEEGPGLGRDQIRVDRAADVSGGDAGVFGHPVGASSY
jgi:hypothetical protein